jgi:hypothetical protein
MPSSKFKQLQTNITLITSEFRNFNSIVTTLPLNQRKLRACIALIHAEFEGYFESIALSIIDAYTANRLSRKQKAKINKFITFYDLIKFNGEKHSIQDRINACIKEYRNLLVKKNHGIKDENLLKILLPISYPIDDLDTTWLTTMTSFGSLRGEMMHQGINQITTLINYNYFDATIITILMPEIKKIDLYFVRNLSLV